MLAGRSTGSGSRAIGATVLWCMIVTLTSTFAFSPGDETSMIRITADPVMMSGPPVSQRSDEDSGGVAPADVWRARGGARGQSDGFAFNPGSHHFK